MSLSTPLRSFPLVVMLAAAWNIQGQDAKATYPSMAPLDQYLMERTSEIALARSAAPESISKDAEVLVLSRNGYERAVEGKNGFVCVVERSWTAGVDDPDFWNPKVRAPICFNPAGARSNIPLTMRKTKLILAGQSKVQMAGNIKAALDSKQMSTPEPGAMCYMMSKDGYLNDRDGHWHPHLMFFLPLTDPSNWGANLPGSQVIGFKDAADGLTLFMVPVGKWSDGTAGPMDSH
jgi:hypothetical protein